MKWSGGFSKTNKMLGKQYSTMGVNLCLPYLKLISFETCCQIWRQEKRSYKRHDLILSQDKDIIASSISKTLDME